MGKFARAGVPVGAFFWGVALGVLGCHYFIPLTPSHNYSNAGDFLGIGAVVALLSVFAIYIIVSTIIGIGSFLFATFCISKVKVESPWFALGFLFIVFPAWSLRYIATGALPWEDRPAPAYNTPGTQTPAVLPPVMNSPGPSPTTQVPGSTFSIQDHNEVRTLLGESNFPRDCVLVEPCMKEPRYDGAGKWPGVVIAYPTSRTFQEVDAHYSRFFKERTEVNGAIKLTGLRYADQLPMDILVHQGKGAGAGHVCVAFILKDQRFN